MRLTPYNWHRNNTRLVTWFERDRAMVRLTDTRDREIICLFDDQVREFIDNGFLNRRHDWHESLAEYAASHKLTTRKG